MSILVIGGDRLGNIKKNLEGEGFERIYHISGRKKGQVNTQISPQIDVVLVLTDYVGHVLAKRIKGRAKEMRVKVFFAKRSWAHIYKAVCM